MLRWLRRLIKPAWRRPYHLALAWLAAMWYGWPARRLAVIGVTGTDGKTTTATMLAGALSAGGPVGLSSTVWFQAGAKRWLNETHMTMPGRFQLQKLLKQMVDAKCKYAVLEVSSEGLVQGRLHGVEVDVAVLTNISPEHIESHGSFEKYRAAKKLLFTAVSDTGPKKIGDWIVPKLAVVNGDDKEATFFLDGFLGQKIITSIAATAPAASASGELVQAVDIKPANDGSAFRIGQDVYSVGLPGEYNVANAAQAIAVAKGFGLVAGDIIAGLAEVKEIPGRFNKIEIGNNRRLVIDYAVTPAAMKSLLENLHQRGAHKIISVFGATGGGRDKWKRPELGKTAVAFADHIILTTEDPFDEDPAVIAGAILAGVPAEQKGSVEIILDRREAIKRALEIAQPGDVIALTGMGSETTMNVAGGKKIEWNDRLVVNELTIKE